MTTILVPGALQGLRTLPASEDLAAGDIVAVYDNAGVATMCKADATDGTKPAHGFVLAAVLSGRSGTIYTTGNNYAMSGLSPGSICYLSTTGGAVTATPPSASGNLYQEVGVALSATELSFMPKTGVIQ